MASRELVSRVFITVSPCIATALAIFIVYNDKNSISDMTTTSRPQKLVLL